MVLFIKKKKRHEHFFPVVSTLLLGFRSIISPLTLMREKIYISLCSFLLDINCLALLIWHSLFGHGPIGALDRAHPNNKFVNYSNLFSLSDLFFFFFPLQKLIKWNLFRYYCAAFETTILFENEYHNNKWKGKAWNHISQSNNEKLKPFHWNSTIIIH